MSGRVVEFVFLGVGGEIHHSKKFTGAPLFPRVSGRAVELGFWEWVVKFIISRNSLGPHCSHECPVALLSLVFGSGW